MRLTPSKHERLEREARLSLPFLPPLSCPLPPLCRDSLRGCDNSLGLKLGGNLCGKETQAVLGGFPRHGTEPEVQNHPTDTDLLQGRSFSHTVAGEP